MDLQIYSGVLFDGTEEMKKKLLGNNNLKEVKIDNQDFLEVKNEEEKDLLERGNIILFTNKGPKVILNEFSKHNSTDRSRSI